MLVNTIAGPARPESSGFGYGLCDTASDINSKTVTIENYNISANGIVSINFTNAVLANSTLNINNWGDKAMFYHNAAITDGIIVAGDTATFIYDGEKYHCIAIDTAKETAASIPILTSDPANPKTGDMWIISSNS